MGVPTSEVGYTPAMPRTEDYKSTKDVAALEGGGRVYLKSNQYIKNVKYNLYGYVLVIMLSKLYLWSDNKFIAMEHVVT